MDVAVGIDAHKDTLAVGVCGALGEVRAVREFANDPRSHRRLLIWVRGFGDRRVIGIEGAGVYGAGLVRHLAGAGEVVREVPAQLTFSERKRRPSQGKSDPCDALAIARAVLVDQSLPSAARDALADDLKVLCDHHDQLSRARTKAINRTHKHLTVLYPGYSKRLPRLTTKAGLKAAMRLASGDRSIRAELVRDLIAEIRRLDAQIGRVNARLATKVKDTGTTLTELNGVGKWVAARILGEIGGAERLGTRGGFAMLTGTAPLAASSGRTHRHRLNRGGNRKLNRALHMVAINQLRTDARAKEYIARKQAEGKSGREALRCLKRQLANVVYRQLSADLAALREAA